MANLDQILKDGLKGAGVFTVADYVLTGGQVNAGAAVLGMAAGVAKNIIDNDKDKEPTTHGSSTRKPPEPHYEPLSMNLNAANNSSFGSPQGVMSGGMSTPDIHIYHHNGDNPPEPKIWDCNKGEDWDVYDTDSNHAPPFFGESDVTERPQTVTNSHKEMPPDLQASIDRWKGKSPSRACDKHGVEMPSNSCYSCDGGGKCENLSLYDGSKKRAHCTFSGQNGKLGDYNAQKNGNIGDYDAQNIPTEPSLSDKPVASLSPAGKPLKTHRKTNRTHLTGIERDNLLGLTDKTLVDDKESLKQELADHIDPTLTFAENKTIIEDYLSGVTPMNTNVTDREIKETEDQMAQDWQNKVSSRRWEDEALIDGLKTRAEMGDSSASAELELLEIQKAEASFVAPAFEPVPIMETAQNGFDNFSNPQNQIPLPLVDTAQIAPDPAMSWCSSTPETIKFSETFVPPEPIDVMDSFNAPAQATAMPKSSISQQNII